MQIYLGGNEFLGIKQILNVYLTKFLIFPWFVKSRAKFIKFIKLISNFKEIFSWKGMVSSEGFYYYK